MMTNTLNTNTKDKFQGGYTVAKKLWCQKHPIFYFLSVWEKRMKRYFSWYKNHQKYVKTYSTDPLNYRVKLHKSLLLRKLGNSDMALQHNKVVNLKIAIKKIDGIIIKPGETFSFWKLVGLPTKRKGYVEGMLLSRGKVMVGIGGGLCQLANLLHWMVLHSPLTITERYHHGFDPFPDNGRVLPFGSGATVFYNYVDYQFTNNTPCSFQIKLWLTDKHLKGELLCDHELSHSYHILEKNHQFIKQDNKLYRSNEIWRDVIDKRTGNIKHSEHVTSNFAEVKYPLDEEITSRSS